jgi:HK97 family phage portal protein
MLADLLSRQKYIAPNGASVDSYGRISRYGTVADAGTFVDENSALSIPGVWRGVNLIANAIGGLPLQDYRNGVRIDTPPILSRPNPPETRIETISAAVAACIIHGNYFAILGATSATGYPDTIYPIAPDRVQLRIEQGRKRFQIDGQSFDQSEVMHVKGFTLPGHIFGVGLLQAQRQGLGTAIALNEYAARYFSGGGQPSGILYSSNPDLDAAEALLLKQQWMNHYGGRSREPAVLNESTKFEAISDNAGDAQLVESRTFDLTEIANMLGLPAYYLGAPNSSRTYSNIENEQQQLLRFSLAPWMIRFEQAFSDLLPRGQVAKFNVDAFLRTDTLTRYQAHKIGIDGGFLTADEARLLEDLQPLEQTQLDAGILEVD